MRRIYAVWAFRAVVNPFSAKAVAFLLLLGQLRAYVSVKHVLYNSPSFMHPMETINFFDASLMNTEFQSLALIGLLGFLGVWLARDSVRRFADGARWNALAAVTFS